MLNLESICDQFILHAIQEWGDPSERRIKAVQDVLNAAHFQAIATCWPVFGGIWPKKCEGPDGMKAQAWLQLLTDTMERGHYENEVAHVRKMIEKRQTPDARSGER